jgi:hypothetical protein
MKAICTRYIPATEARGARVRASAEGVRPVTISHWSADDSHLEAALALARQYGWNGKLVRGGAPDGRGDCFVFLGDKEVTV